VKSSSSESHQRDAARGGRLPSKKTFYAK